MGKYPFHLASVTVSDCQKGCVCDQHFQIHALYIPTQKGYELDEKGFPHRWRRLLSRKSPYTYDLCPLFSTPYSASGWEVRGRWWEAVGLSADQLECRPYVAGIPRMWAGLGELTNLKTQSGDRMSRAEEGRTGNIKMNASQTARGKVDGFNMEK